MITSFICNQEKAKTVGSGKYITKTGAYRGVISQASVRELSTGSIWIDLVFKCDEGAIAFVDMCILSKTKERTFNHDIFDALMVVLGVQEAKVMQGKVFDRNGQPHDGYRIPSLEKKYLGFILQREQRFYIDQTTGQEKETYQMNLATPFDATTQKTAREMLDNLEAKRVADLSVSLKDKPGKHVVGSVPAGYSQADMATTDSGFDSGDVPF